MLFELLLCFLFVLHLVYVKTRKPLNFPLGPPRLPIVGSLPYMVARSNPSEPPTFLHGVLRNVNEYGKVVGFYIGREPTCYIGDYAIMKKVLMLDETTYRPSVMPLNEFRDGWETLNGTENEGNVPGIGGIEGKEWKAVRGFTLKNLKDFGLGKQKMEDLIVREVETLINQLTALGGKPIALNQTFNVAVINSLMAILLGKRFDLDDPTALETARQIGKSFKEANGIRVPLGTMLPSPKMLLWPGLMQLSGFDKMTAALTSMRSLLDPIMNRHWDNFNPDSINDFFDSILNQVHSTTDPNSIFFKDRGLAVARGTIIDLFVAGSESTPSSLQWAFLYMLHHPDVKRRVQAELDQVCGPNRLPRTNDKEDLPVTQAVLHESFRLSCLIPFSVPQRTAREVTVGPYTIPKNTTLFTGLIHVMRDPETFPNPSQFNPERFLTADGKFKPSEKVIPFGVGKRACPCRSLAEQEYFLFFSAIMKNFDIDKDPAEVLPSYDINDNTCNSVLRPPPNFKCIFTRRSASC